MTEYTPPKPHRPLVTNHGIHCTCGVFCGSKLESWGGHASDRFLLDPTTRIDPRPITVSQQTINDGMDAIREAFRAVSHRLGEALRPLARLNLQLSPPDHAHTWQTIRDPDVGMWTKCMVCGIRKEDFTRA